MSARDTDNLMNATGAVPGKGGQFADAVDKSGVSARRNRKVTAVTTTISDSAVEMRVGDRKSFESLIRDQIQIHESFAASSATPMAGSATVVANLLAAVERAETNAEVDAAFDAMEVEAVFEMLEEVTPVWERETVAGSEEESPGLEDLSPASLEFVESDDRDTLKPPRHGDEDEGISRGAEVSDSIMSLDGLSETLEPEDEEIVLSDKELNDLAETGKALMAVAEELTRDQSGNNPGAESERAPQNVQAVVGADEPAPGGISPDDSSSATPDTDDLPDEVSIQSLTPDTDDLPGEASIQSLTVDGVVGEDRGAVSVVPKESDSESVTDGAAPQRTDEHSSSEVIPAETESRQTPVVSSGHRSVIWEKHDAGELLQAIRTSVPPPPDKRKVERARNRWRALAIASILLVMAMGGWTISGMSAAERDGWLEMFRGGGEGLRPGSVPDDGAIAPIRAKENIRVASGKTSPAATASVSLGGEAPKTTSSGEVVSVAGTAGEGAGVSKPQRAAEPQGSSTSSAAMESPRSGDETERKNDERKDRARDGESRSSSVPVRSDRPSARRDTTGELPSRPSEKAVRDAMAKVAPLVQNCGRESSGKMVVQMVVSGASGKVVASEVIDDTFRDTVAGRCAVRAIQRVQFPEFKRDRIIIRYPFAL